MRSECYQLVLVAHMNLHLTAPNVGAHAILERSICRHSLHHPDTLTCRDTIEILHCLYIRSLYVFSTYVYFYSFFSVFHGEKANEVFNCTELCACDNKRL